MIAVVIPCYRERSRILSVLERIGKEVDRVYVVDDGCPDETGEFVRARCNDPRVQVIRHDHNQGVGAATLTGYRAALADGAEIIVKLDGDGQMDPAFIPRLVSPIVAGAADYTKGNRFYELDGLRCMPTSRKIGNAALSFLTKLSSGYWNVFDPTNGFTAIHARVAERLPLDKISPTYFFESDMLFRLSTIRAVVRDVPMEARYGDEQSHLRIPEIVGEFLVKHAQNTLKRIFYNYFLRSFSVATIELCAGLALASAGTMIGIWYWVRALTTGIPTTSGSVMSAALPVMVGMQLFVAFLMHDAQDFPKEPLHLQLS